MIDPKQKVQSIIKQIEKGEISFTEGWSKIRTLKDDYVDNLDRHDSSIKDSEQSWHSFIGNKFEKLVRTTILAYLKELKQKDETFKGLTILTTSELQKKRYEIIFRKLAVRYGEYLLLPDIDLSIVDFNDKNPWESIVIAIISCKTSLRERIAQACYWKLKLMSSDATRHIKIFLATVDNDKDFTIDLTKKRRIHGKSRNRIIAEYELDGIYILRDDFSHEWESSNIKKYERIFEDLTELFKSSNMTNR